jgi:hypothetical protein
LNRDTGRRCRRPKKSRLEKPEGNTEPRIPTATSEGISEVKPKLEIENETEIEIECEKI